MSRVLVVNSDSSEACLGFVNSKGEFEYTRFIASDGGVDTHPTTNLAEACADSMDEYLDDCDAYTLEE